MPRRNAALGTAEVKVETPSETKKSTPPSQDDGATKNTSTSSARPRRNVRKNVLYKNEDYELHHSGPLLANTSEKAATSRASTIPTLAAEEPQSPPPTKRTVTFQSDMLKGAKKRKIPPHLAEMMDNTSEATIRSNSNQGPEFDEESIADGANLEVAMEFEVPHNDDGPPVLGPSIGFNEDIFRDSGDELEDDDLTEPPDLERNPPSKKRGRPPRRQHDQGTVKVKLMRPSSRVTRPAQSDAVVSRTTHANQKNVKLFEEELNTTPEGDTYATVINGCLTELLRKERIIDLLTNPVEIELIQKSGWFLAKPPRLPPLVTDKACFAFYVDGSRCKNAKDLSYDDLRPWSSTSDTSNGNTLNIKPNVRRHPVARLNGVMRVVKHETRLAEFHLTEYSARLPREQRLRKKIFYLTRDNVIHGNVLILYDYVNPGNAPAPVSLPHGNDRLRGAAMEDMDSDVETDSPFELHPYQGARDGYFLKLRSSKLGWAHNKKQLLDYLYNKADLINQLGALNSRLPDLPPLIETVGVFAYFVPAVNIVNQIHHAADGLSPWTTNPGGMEDGRAPPRVRSTRRALVEEANGDLSLARDQKAQSEVCLVETMSTLARCPRVRKRVFYVQQSNAIILGNVCYIYEFLRDGEIPTLFPALDQKQYGGSTRWPTHPNKKEESNAIEMSSHILNGQDPFDDDLDLLPVDEDGIGDVMDVHKDISDHHQLQEENPILMYPDILNGGYDPEFNDDPIDKAENPEPYYDHARTLSTNHVYLTVRHKKVVTAVEHVLEWIANSNTVEERGILNSTKPSHPPLVTNSRAYAFFVAGAAIFPHDINRDDFSPWSHNGNAENPTCYRTKVRKLGVNSDPTTSLFVLKDAEYRLCPYHLVYLYSINPKEPRLRKKIYYLMETESKMVVSHALILYDYNIEGEIPKLNAGQYKSLSKKNFGRENLPAHDLFNEVSDNEEGRDCPFNLPAGTADDGTFYMELLDQEFWNNRNRQLQYLVNQPNLVEEMGALNNKVPDMPPLINGKGTFVFFVNGEEVNYRSLTIDKLVPWSENVCTNPHGTTKRPKTAKFPLGFNRNNQLRVFRNNANIANIQSDFNIHIYTATLPRCTRLRKKVIYVLRQGRPLGHALIMYSYTEVGVVPQLLNKYTQTAEEWFDTLNPNVREDIYHLLKTMSPAEIVKVVYQDHGIHVNPNMIYSLKHREIRDSQLEGETLVTEWTDADGAGPTSSTKIETVEEVVTGEQMDKAIMGHDMMVEGEMIVEHTEVIEQTVQYEQPIVRRNPFLEKSVTTSGFVRGSQRYDALWRIAQKQFGANCVDDTFDQLFRLLLEKNENRLLQMINHTFNVEIFPGEEEPVTEDGMHYMQEHDHPVLVDHHGHSEHHLHSESESLQHIGHSEHLEHSNLPEHAKHPEQLEAIVPKQEPACSDPTQLLESSDHLENNLQTVGNDDSIVQQ